MLVEFIGSTGAGKTTLISKVREELQRSQAVTTPFELAAGRIGLANLTNPTMRNLIQEIVGFPYFLASLGAHREFLSFMLKMYARQARLSVFMLNNLRSLERKLGVYTLARRRADGPIVLVDEGTVLSSHNVFVYSQANYGSEEISTFARLVPLPDIIVYIKAPVDVLVERSLRRADPPRELRSREPELVRRQVSRAAAMFEELVGADRLRSRVLVVENADDQPGDPDRKAHSIIEFILQAAPTAHARARLDTIRLEEARH